MKKIGLLILIVVIILGVVIIRPKNTTKIPNSKNSDTWEESVDFDEDTQIYYVKDSETGKIRGASRNKEDLQIFIDNPKYDPYPSEYDDMELTDFLIDE